MADFCPHEAGIIDTVTQLLLPSITGDLEKPLPRSEVAEKYNLSHAQETELHYAISRLTRQEGDYINSSDVQNCLSGLQVAPESTEEMLEIMGRLDPTGSGLTLKEDFVEVAALRLSSRRVVVKQTLAPNERHRRMLCRGI